MNLRSLFVLALGVSFSCFVMSADAGTLVSDDFSYPDGDLVGNGGWANHSGSGSFIQVTSGEAVLTHGGGSREDANTGFAVKTDGVLTATFDITVSDDAPITGADNEYFAHFFEAGSFNFVSRLDVVAPTVGGDYTLGISTDTSTAQANLPVDFTFGSTVSVSIEFDIDAGTGSLTVGGDTVSGSVGVAPDETIDAFALRQSNSGDDETVTVDNLVITFVPEPTSFVLMFAGLMGLATTRRR